MSNITFYRHYYIVILKQELKIVVGVRLLKKKYPIAFRIRHNYTVTIMDDAFDLSAARKKRPL